MKHVLFLLIAGAIVSACQKSVTSDPQQQQPPPHDSRTVNDTLMVYAQKQASGKSIIISKDFKTGETKPVVYDGTSPFATNMRMVYIKNGNTLGFGRLDGASKMLIQLTQASYPCLSIDSRLFSVVDHVSDKYQLILFDTVGNKNVLYESSTEITSPVFTEDGQKIVFSQKSAPNSSNIYSIPVAGGLPQQLTPTVADNFDQYCAVAGTNVYFSRTRNIGNSVSSEIFSVDLNGSNIVQKTNYTNNWTTPTFYIKDLRRVNSSTLIFCSNRENSSCDLFLYKIDGIENIVRMTDTKEEESFPSMIPDYVKNVN